MRSTAAARAGTGAIDLPRSMRALVRHEYGPIDVLAVREMELPALGDDEVLVEVRAAGLDRGAWHLTTGQPYPLRLAGYGVRRPKRPILGADGAGVVVAAGAGVRTLQAGDEVFGVCNGSFAEYAVARADKLSRKPSGLTFEEAAALPVSGLTALQAVRDRGRVQPGQHVLVVGASGGVGTLAVQIAKAFGAEVTGVCSTAKVDLVRSVGADHVVDYLTTDITETGRRYDAVLDIGGARPLSQLRRMLTPVGTLVLVGGDDRNRWLGPIGRIARASLTSLVVRQRLVSFIASENAVDLAALRDLVDQGSLRPVIDRVVALDGLADAMRDLEAGRVNGKVVATI